METVGGWRETLYNEVPHNLHSLSGIIRMIKSGSMGCAGHVAHIEESGLGNRD
jgi:hypothetical protein